MKAIFNTEELTNFIYMAHFEIYTTEGRLMSIGLPIGESKNLLPWFSRKKQIAMLNHIQENWLLYQDLIRRGTA